MLRRKGPGDGKCVWCGENEDYEHILFRCIVTRFAWSVIREPTGCTWNPARFLDLFWLVQGTRAMIGDLLRLDLRP